MFGDVIRSFPSPATLPEALAFDGKSLINADGFTNRLYWIDRATGLVLQSVLMNITMPGLHYVNGQLYVSDTTHNTILLCDANGNVMKSWATEGDAYGILIDETMVYVGDVNAVDYVNIFNRTPASFLRTQRINRFSLPGDFMGFCTDGKLLYVSSYSDNTIKAVDKAGNIIQSVAVTARPMGICFDGKNLWIGNDLTDTIYCISRN